VKILSLTMTNFMPYKGDVVVEFPTDSSLNVMIVFGDNMRGKTSFLNALRWAFYGRALGRHLHEIPLLNLLNREATAEGDFSMEVGVRFEAGGHRYDLRRRATKRDHVALPSRTEDMRVDCSLQKDSIVVVGNQVEAEINRFIPEQVSRFFLFDGELLQEYETLLMEGSEQGRRIKDAIEQVLGVPTLLLGRDEIGTILKQAQKQQTKDLQQMQGMDAQAEHQSSLQAKEGAQERDIEALKARLKETKEQREALDDELEKVEGVHRAKTRSTELGKRQAEILAKQEGNALARLGLVKTAWLDLIQAQLKVRQGQLLEEQARISNIVERKARIDTRVEDLEMLLSEASCPTCKQQISSENRGKFATQLANLKAETISLEVDGDALARVSNEISEVSKLIQAGVGKQIRNLVSEDRSLSVELTRVDNEKEKIDEQIRGYDTEAIASQRRLRDALIKQEGSVEQRIVEAERDLGKTRNELAVLSKVIANLPAARAKRSTAKVALCQALGKVFSESVERLREDLRRKVQQKATEAFRRLTTQEKYERLEINSNYGLTIIDENGNPVEVRSAGAEQIVALSLIDGLARTGRAAGPVVMDTPFGRLDPKHRENILRYLPENTSQLVLLVHEGEIRKETDLTPIASRIGKSYVIEEVTPRHSKIKVQPL